MGNCTYCGKPTGLFKKSHKECEDKYNEGWKKMLRLSASSAIKGGDYKSLVSSLSEIASNCYIQENKVDNVIIKGYEIAVEKFLDDGVLTPEEESKLDEYQEYFGLTQQMLDQNGSYTKVIKSGILREVLEGNIPERLNIYGHLPFNFQKSEKLVWIFQNVPYYEQKVRREFKGGYGGFTVRVAKGLYYRAGAFKGHPVETLETVHIDTGLVGITDKHIYFSGNNKSFRVNYGKIVSFTPYDDGIGIQRDATSAKPQIFITGDGWFTSNLITNLSNL